MENRRWLPWALGAVLVIGTVLVIVALVGGGDDDDGETAGSTTTATDRSTTTSSPSTSTSSTTSTTASTPGDDGGPEEPEPITELRSVPGGGSGEVVVSWDAVAGATGYRVLRSETTGGDYEEVADLDVTTGTATAGAEVVNIWSDVHSYVPPGDALAAPDPSPTFQYVEVAGGGERCFRVVAYDASGDLGASGVACGSPP